MVLDFFKNLVRYRVEGARSKANAKIYGAKARVQGKVASKFNKAVDAPMKKAQAKAKGMAKGGAKKKKGRKSGGGSRAKPKAQEGKVGLFGKKKDQSGGGHAAPPASDFEPGMKTQAIDISEVLDDRSQDVVGWVVCLNGALRGQDFRLVTGRNVLGTAADCDIVVTDPYLSSKHAAIRHENGRFTLIDLDSTNGTFHNERRMSKEELIDNDKIRIGRTELKFKSLF